MNLTVEAIEEMHHTVQLNADRILNLSALTVALARELANSLKAWQDSLPVGTDPIREAEATFTDELQAWLPEYGQLRELGGTEPIKTANPRIIREGMRLLDIIPATTESHALA